MLARAWNILNENLSKKNRCNTTGFKMLHERNYQAPYSDHHHFKACLKYSQ